MLEQPEANRMANVPFSGIREVFEECDRLEAQGQNIVHLEIGRPDFDTPSPIKQGAIEALDRGDVHYTSNYGILPLREKLATKLEEENGIRYNPDDEIVVTCGATEAVFVTLMGLIGTGDEVLLPDPSWTYPAGVRLAGGEPTTYELDPATGFQPDIDSLRKAVSAQTKLLIVNSPNNPTGGVLSEQRAKALRDFAVDNDLIVLSDEIYEKILYDDKSHHSLAALDGMRDRTVTINGFSKAYSMTGWRLGYLAAPVDLVDPIIRARQYTSTCAPSISQHAAVRAVGSGLHEPMVEAFERRRDRVCERIKRIPGMSCPDPTGAFYAFPTLPEGYTDDQEFVFSLLRESGVALVPGSVFGDAGKGNLRIAYSNSVEQIDEAFDRLEHWL
ncbi:aspartate aminotransferase [Halorubrum persicum]|uniref:Aminotransferase n=1 Tax=Halorubrum persicum TaxID=1383844 RepID=A0A2G1WJ11_9EURY|nr:pyridoxal phosphate-dependent aminotransferase [Halorubrum persicum]PHQ38972.1 aspartate aminotransferase [Halorubrum persicum]